MPFVSDKQRRYVYAKAAQGEKWAKKFILDSGESLPKPRKKLGHMKSGNTEYTATGQMIPGSEHSQVTETIITTGKGKIPAGF